MGAVAAGVSVISGISSLASQGRQAREQREQLRQQQYQAALQSAATEATIRSNQVLARQEYNAGVLSRLAAYQQATVGATAQQALNDLQSQQAAYQTLTGGLQAGLQAAQQTDALRRQATQTEINTDNLIQASAKRQGAVSAAVADEATKQTALLTEAERKNISRQAAGKVASRSSDLGRDRDLRMLVGEALGGALQLDRASLASQLQGVNEETLAIIAEQIGLSDTNLSMQQVQENLKMQLENVGYGLATIDRSADAARGATDTTLRQIETGYQLQENSAKNAYNAQQYNLGVQAATGQQTAQSVQNSYASAINNVRGPGFIDFLNFGLQTYGAVSPWLTSRSNQPTPPRLQPNFSGFPTNYSNVV